MVKPIVKDVIFLNQQSELATEADMQIVHDLMDTLRANETGCVGMAANMIGEKKRIIVVNMGISNIPMINPVILKKSEPYETEEGCLSLEGVRKTTRYNDIEVDFYDTKFIRHKQKYSGWIAQIIQHEIDHCDGIII